MYNNNLFLIVHGFNCCAIMYRNFHLLMTRVICLILILIRSLTYEMISMFFWRIHHEIVLLKKKPCVKQKLAIAASFSLSQILVKKVAVLQI